MGIIYIDSLFLINLLADYVLLIAACRVSALSPRRLRCLLAALFGALFAVLSVVPGFWFLSMVPYRFAIAAAMGLIAFGAERGVLRCIAVFIAVSASFEGFITALGPATLDLRVLLFSFPVFYILLSLISAYRAKLHTRRTVEVSIRFLGRSGRFRALVDSGNCLTDALSGADVLIVRASALRDIFRENAAVLEISDPVEFISALDNFPELRGKFRLVPYSALGGGGLLPVFRAEELSINGKTAASRLCGIAPELLGDGFDAITGLP